MNFIPVNKRKHAKHSWFSWLLAILLLLSPLGPFLSPAPATADDSSSAFMVTASEESPFSWDNASVYFVVTDRFNDGDQSNNNSYGRLQRDATGKNIGTFHGGDIKGLTQKLEQGYFTDLGVNAIWITAPYEQIHGWVGGGDAGDFAHYAYHGYYPLDFTMMDKNMGTVEEMREFVDLAHSRGIRIVLDVVMNHVGYATLQDMNQYSFGSVNGISHNWTPGSGQSWHSYTNHVDYQNASAWSTWWGGFVRSGIAGYSPCGGDERTQCLSGLPDIRTDVTNSVGLPPILANKWSQETTGFTPWIIPAASDLRQNLNIPPADYVTKWLAAWVAEFGIDGFRVDTAKHVELNRWKQLKTEANAALQTWRQNNPNKPGANWTDDFWMTAEVWGHGVGKSEYFNNGFDSVINFAFQGTNMNALEATFSQYAAAINTDPDFNVLSYISSHDTSLYSRNNLMQAGTALLLLPGGIQIFYGDETARPVGESGSDSHQGTRSFMNWNSINQNVQAHWQKLGQFRNNHLAVGAGSHQQLTTSPYTFQRSYNKNGIEDHVVVVTGANGTVDVNVGTAFGEGAQVRDAYTGNTAVVTNGKATFTAHANGVILIEQTAPSNKPSVTASPAGGVFKTDTVNVTLNVERASSGKYTLDGSNPQQSGITFTSGTQITLGEDMAFSESKTLRLFAENEFESSVRDYTFTKKDPNAALAIHFKKPANWSTPQMYYYETSPAVAEPTWATAPAMTPEGGDWYVYHLTGVDQARVIFKDSSGKQLPAASQPGFLVTADGWYSDQWYDSNPDREDTEAPTAPAQLTASATTDTAVTLTWLASTDDVGVSGYQIIRDGSVIGTSAATSYTATGLTPNTTYTFTVKAFDASNNLSAASEPVTITTTEAAPGNTVTIYYKQGFTTPYIHYKLNGVWTTPPGIAMSASEIAGYHKFTVDIGNAVQLEACFNNGSGVWDSNNGQNYIFPTGLSTFSGGSITPGLPQPDSLTLTATVPAGTTGDIYLSGTMNNWNPSDDNYKLTPNSNGTYSIQLNIPSGTTLQYKLTRGNWNTVEVSNSGADIANRALTTTGGAQTLQITVQRWKN